MLISSQYRELNKRLHDDRADYGTSGKRYVPVVERLMAKYGTRDVLDYGCGKRTLEKALGFEIHNYDPCIDGLDAPPQPHDLVVSTDVLEHIEPGCLDAVLADIRRCTRKAAYLVIATRPAVKVLPDGRNAHLILESHEWWAERLLRARLKETKHQEFDGEFALLCEPLE
jgi:hypothetical protein